MSELFYGVTSNGALVSAWTAVAEATSVYPMPTS